MVAKPAMRELVLRAVVDARPEMKRLVEVALPDNSVAIVPDEAVNAWRVVEPVTRTCPPSFANGTFGSK